MLSCIFFSCEKERTLILILECINILLRLQISRHDTNYAEMLKEQN